MACMGGVGERLVQVVHVVVGGICPFIRCVDFLGVGG